ncbi:sigma-70 family RNA polymerase sigma factor [Nannocystis pusilla]|uniref:Sigma-70 family RNA polymerase sigma factor n=1 Tax=Nannocystis pusilla TaxID=889268 RepID=A0A9X3EZZ4_9BACT|nr:sigma-70 family RNA polymerase sigma factor [Nannocystis pusilla]MCY1013447.1 sigma-70 family RNA polymerase sigma factor [Nannocystis pusilla]
MDVHRSNDSDHELLCAWQGGDRRAGDLFIRHHGPALARFFRNKLTTPADSHDLVQETFLALQRTAGRAGPAAAMTSVRAYLFSIARRVLCAHLRKKYKRTSEALDFGSVCVKQLEPTSMSALMMRRRELRVFIEALRAIPLDDQVLLEAKYFDAMSVREIGVLLALPEPVVPGRLQRAKGRLRQKIEEVSVQSHRMAPPEVGDDALDLWAQEIRARLV